MNVHVNMCTPITHAYPRNGVRVFVIHINPIGFI